MGVVYALCALLSVATSATRAAEFDPRFAASRSVERFSEVDQVSAPSSVATESVPEVTPGDEQVAVVSATSDATGLCGSGSKLVWHDDFVSSKSVKEQWNYVIGDGCDYGICGWGNNELEVYTNSTKNVRVSNGNLQIVARMQGKTFTSGKVRTFNKFAVRPVGKETIRIDARVKMPLGVGLWPSINLLPEDSPEFCLGCGYYGDWPQSGAITLSQRLNKDKDYTGGILYGGVAPSVAASTFSQKIASEPTGYHTYTLEWSSSKMKWKLDGKTVYTAKSGQGNPEKGWYSLGQNATKNSPFDKPFYIMIGMALGGDQTGASAKQVQRTLKNPQAMQIEYIRVCSQ
jgi:beta-glucanase (GH16 family)